MIKGLTAKFGISSMLSPPVIDLCADTSRGPRLANSSSGMSMSVTGDASVMVVVAALGNTAPPRLTDSNEPTDGVAADGEARIALEASSFETANIVGCGNGLPA